MNKQKLTPWAKNLNWNLIVAIAKRYKIDPDLIAAIIWVESRNKAWAMRYEPNYKWLYKVPTFAISCNITEETETQMQKHSFGLMQVMGGVARELGMNDELVRLCKPNVGVSYGARKLRQLFDRYNNLKDVIASYNAGSPRKKEDGSYVNQSYVDKVYKLYLELK